MCDWNKIWPIYKGFITLPNGGSMTTWFDFLMVNDMVTTKMNFVKVIYTNQASLSLWELQNINVDT